MRRHLEQIAMDIRYARRGLAGAPAVTMVAALSLALGIGANTAIFSQLDAVLSRRPGGVSSPQDLVGVYGMVNGRVRSDALSLADVVAVRQRTRTLAGVAAEASIWLWMTHGAESTELWGKVVTEDYFAVLGVRPRAGRFFRPDVDGPAGSAQPAAVLSYRLWQQHFSGSPDVVGTPIVLNRTHAIVVGVAPRDFIGLETGHAVDVWLPVDAVGASLARPSSGFDLVGRPAPGRSVAEVRAELATIVPREGDARESPGPAPIYVAPLRGVHPAVRADVARAPQLLAAVVACLLLITCANLAGLLLSRSAGREHEMAIRSALGAGRLRLVRQVLAESLLVAAIGAAAALLVALWVNALTAPFYAYRVGPLNPSLSAQAFAFTLGLATLSALAFGIAPAWEASRAAPFGALRQHAGRTAGRASIRTALVVSEVVLSFVLIVGAGLLLQSLRAIVERPGYEQRQIAQYRMRPGRVGYTSERAETYYRELMRRLSGLPGVRSVVLASVPPMRGWLTRSVSLPEAPSGSVETDSTDVTPGFFETLDIPLMRGRGFTEQDGRRAAPVAIVSQALAERLWRTQDAVGRTLLFDGREHTVVGVTRDIHAARPGEPPPPYLYLAYWQSAPVDARLLVRVDGDARAMVDVLRPHIVAVDPDVHVGQEMTLTARTAMSYETERLIGGTLTATGLLALALTSIGLYGMLAYSVSRRTREIGVRVALGADQRRIVRLVVCQGMRPVLAGVALGVPAALATTTVLRTYLYGLTDRDPTTFVVAAGVVLAVTLVACYVPARRAANVDPVVALQGE